MKRVLKWLGALLLLVVVVLGGLALYVQMRGLPRYKVEAPSLTIEVTPERVARGKRFANTLCALCHMDPVTKKLTGKQMEDAPAEFGVIYSKNITRHPDKGIGRWTDGELVYFLRTGIHKDGRYVPPYMVKLPYLSDEDLYSIVAFLRSDDPLVAADPADPPGVTRESFLVKVLARVAFGPLPMPKQKIEPPPASDAVAFGRYLVVGFDCFGCHSADFKTMNVAEPEKTPGYMGGGNKLNDLMGGIVQSANLTFDEETGIGKWSEEDFVRALKRGFRPDRRPLRYPMVLCPDFTDDEAKAIYAYLRTVPKIKNAIPRTDAVPPPSADEGKKLYYKYACVSCHGTSGVGVADLRRAAEHYPDDEALKGWIKNAPSVKPGTKMPAWEGVIAEADYAPLIAYVKTLAVK
jgi:mono/diheme cytochrome c family protein